MKTAEKAYRIHSVWDVGIEPANPWNISHLSQAAEMGFVGYEWSPYMKNSLFREQVVLQICVMLEALFNFGTIWRWCKSEK